MLPSGDKYLLAVQNPKQAFSDSDLAVAKIETGQIGLPRPYSGGFTTTFHATNHKMEWAARCFTRPIDGLDKRYAAFEMFFRRYPSSYFTDTLYLKNGIRVDGEWHPIVKMRWMDGKSLNDYIDANVRDATKIAKLLSDFEELVEGLEKLGIAHGDLQHGNIIVTASGIKLIDYDGLYVPELASLPANEIGHINYQHPQREALHYGPAMDRFSAIVIYLALKSVVSDPSLWRDDYNNGDNMLFTRQDFEEPAASPILHEIVRYPELATLVERFRGVCVGDYANMPSLEDFQSGNFSYNKNVTVHRAGATAFHNRPHSQYPVLDAELKHILLKHVGSRVEVIGKITEARKRFYRGKIPYVILNFGHYPKQTFSLFFFGPKLIRFSDANIDPAECVNHWVRISGVLSVYEGTPQIDIKDVNQFHVLKGESEARQWLQPAAITHKHPTAQIVSRSASQVDKLTEAEKILKRLYPPVQPSPNIPTWLPAVSNPTPSTQQTISANITGGVSPRAGSASKPDNIVVGVLFTIIGAALVVNILGNLIRNPPGLVVLIAVVMGAWAGWNIGKRI